MSSNPAGFGRFPGIATGATCPATHIIVIASQSVTTLACAGAQPLAVTAASRATRILGFMCALLIYFGVRLALRDGPVVAAPLAMLTKRELVAAGSGTGFRSTKILVPESLENDSI